jgi:hypothetical protein
MASVICRVSHGFPPQEPTRAATAAAVHASLCPMLRRNSYQQKPRIGGGMSGTLSADMALCIN